MEIENKGANNNAPSIQSIFARGIWREDFDRNANYGEVRIRLRGKANCNMGGRRNNFTPEEILALAKAWVVVSKKVDEQNADTFWSNVASKYAEMPEADPRTQRSANSLRCQRTTVQRNTQKYLAADSLYRSNILSGETEEDTKENIMEFYRQKNKVKGRNGELKPPPPIKYLPAVWLLSQEPKFSQKYSGSSEEKNGYRGISGSCTSGYKSH